VEQLRLHGREVVARVSSFLTFAGDIHVARHVDIDGIGQEDTASSTDYMHTVDNARLLVRTLEVVFQSICDDCSVLLLTIQSVRDSDTGHEKPHTHEYLDALSTSLGANLGLLVQTLDSLLSVGHDQAEMALGEYTGSIDWRMSRVSMRPITELGGIYGAEASDMDIKVVKDGSSYEPYGRNVPGGLDPNRSIDLTEETLVEIDRPDVPLNNPSPLFENDRKSAYYHCKKKN
jgi:son of sevenless-like protein